MYVCMYVYKVRGDHGAPSNHILSPASVMGPKLAVML